MQHSQSSAFSPTQPPQPLSAPPSQQHQQYQQRQQRSTSSHFQSGRRAPSGNNNNNLHNHTNPFPRSNNNGHRHNHNGNGQNNGSNNNNNNNTAPSTTHNNNNNTNSNSQHSRPSRHYHHTQATAFDQPFNHVDPVNVPLPPAQFNPNRNPNIPGAPASTPSPSPSSSSYIIEVQESPYVFIGNLNFRARWFVVADFIKSFGFTDFHVDMPLLEPNATASSGSSSGSESPPALSSTTPSDGGLSAISTPPPTPTPVVAASEDFPVSTPYPRPSSTDHSQQLETSPLSNLNPFDASTTEDGTTSPTPSTCSPVDDGDHRSDDWSPSTNTTWSPSANTTNDEITTPESEDLASPPDKSTSVPRQSTRSKGYAVVSFKSIEIARRAIEVLNGSILHERPIIARFDQFPPKKPKYPICPGHRVFIRGLSPTFQWYELKALCSPFGVIERADIQILPPKEDGQDTGGKSKKPSSNAVGYVTFKESHEAALCVQYLNGCKLLGTIISCRLYRFFDRITKQEITQAPQVQQITIVAGSRRRQQLQQQQALQQQQQQHHHHQQQQSSNQIRPPFNENGQNGQKGLPSQNCYQSGFNGYQNGQNDYQNDHNGDHNQHHHHQPQQQPNASFPPYGHGNTPASLYLASSTPSIHPPFIDQINVVPSPSPLGQFPTFTPLPEFPQYSTSIFNLPPPSVQTHLYDAFQKRLASPQQEIDIFNVYQLSHMDHLSHLAAQQQAPLPLFGPQFGQSDKTYQAIVQIHQQLRHNSPPPSPTATNPGANMMMTNLDSMFNTVSLNGGPLAPTSPPLSLDVAVNHLDGPAHPNCSFPYSQIPPQFANPTAPTVSYSPSTQSFVTTSALQHHQSGQFNGNNPNNDNNGNNPNNCNNGNNGQGRNHGQSPHRHNQHHHQQHHVLSPSPPFLPFVNDPNSHMIPFSSPNGLHSLPSNTGANNARNNTGLSNSVNFLQHQHQQQDHYHHVEYRSGNANPTINFNEINNGLGSGHNNGNNNKNNNNHDHNTLSQNNHSYREGSGNNSNQYPPQSHSQMTFHQLRNAGNEDTNIRSNRGNMGPDNYSQPRHQHHPQNTYEQQPQPSSHNQQCYPPRQNHGLNCNDRNIINNNNFGNI